MNCRECHDFIDAYIDNELDVATAILVKQHLRDCSQCQQLLESREVVGALLNNPQVPFEVPDSLLAKIHLRFRPPHPVRSTDPPEGQPSPGSTFHWLWRRRSPLCSG